MSTLILKGVTKQFGDFYAARDISLTAEEGEFVTLLGPSGCGKTTLLKMISGFHQPDSGEIILNGKPITNLPPEKRNTAMCFQSYALFPHLNVSHNICFGLKQKKVSISNQQERLEESLKQVGLVEQRLKMPSQLSGGQQQRVALARAMITRPDLVLFDEPLSNLDAKLRESVRFEIKELQRLYQLTSIYVTHDQAEALSISDKIVVLNGGSIAQVGSPEDVYYRPNSRFVADFIGAANIDEAHVEPAEQPEYYRIACKLGNFYVKSANPPSAKHCYICWRPEDAKFVQAPSSIQNRFSLVIEKMAFMGNLTEAWGSNDNKSLSVRLQLVKKPPIAIGERAEFYLPEDAIHFLEPVTEGKR
ncbi:MULTISPECIES: ABC transporter ATP-binding protein [Providencia]|uniref:ABC transporter n=1 Tax=Providencia stuartii (strain MRSN 2154) TaxID=1157951 RepID=A0A140NID4_PROSM|nr:MULTISPECIES: ABC transporter ATP-binding protein [Providencia]AFH91946.1 ABC transporter [Providencia stuartii MRSN 2154]MDT7044865.1 ABC transporter ATP-binding protein [Providencia stuartii]MDT7049874.1 ABC transporter ATP-binding protein [Providencia stuartii]MTC10450.1 ATP-binding cassette domain-containing protein [Providencia stuartii]NPD41889.1 ABC transporter ATP-binding protein [Providencia stuartii]